MVTKTRTAWDGLLHSTLTVCVIALACAACTTSSNMSGGDDAGGGGGDAGGGNGGGGSGGGDGSGGNGSDEGPISSNWSVLPLLNDAANRVFHAGEDLVTGIYFASRDRGWIVTQGANQSFGRGGAVFTARQHAVTGVAFAAPDGGPSLAGSVDFVGIEPTPTGYIAMAYAADVVASVDRGATWTIQRGGMLQLGISPVIGLSVTTSGTTLVAKSGVVATSTSAPGPDATFLHVWAPIANPPIPNPVPAELCQGGPIGAGAPTTRESVWISPDRQTIAYTVNPNHVPQICISHDGGSTFLPVSLDVPDEDTDVPPTGILFLTPTTGITWLGAADAVTKPYVKRTTDGGVTWVDAALPPSLVPLRLELHGAFFARDARHGWITGYDRDGRVPVLLSTSDAGARWTMVESGLVDAVRDAGGDKLFCGFALDAEHFWIGGARGLVLAHE